MTRKVSKPRQTGEKRPLRFVSSSPTTYANIIAVVTGAFDIRLRFGELVDADEKEVRAREVASVVMAPAQGQSLIKLLQDTIQKHEQMFGKIVERKNP